MRSNPDRLCELRKGRSEGYPSDLAPMGGKMITFDEKNNILRLDTRNTTYAMKIVRERYVTHLYYGEKRADLEKFYQEVPISFAPYPKGEGVEFSLDTISTELSFFGSGDFRDTALKIKNGNGDSVTFFEFVAFQIHERAEKIKGMPCSRGGGETIELIYRDKVSACELHAYYTVFEECDTITRRVKLVNRGAQRLTVQTLFPCQLDFDKKDFNLLTLSGAYYSERHRQIVPLHLGRQSIFSQRGHSSHHHNPFAALLSKNATENSGDVYGVSFVYSGDFELQVEKRRQQYSGRQAIVQTRLLIGMNRNTFEWTLDGGEEIESPETILTFSARGLNGMSQNFHDHLRRHIINPKFTKAPRPVLVNTWEAAYFDINEDVILKYADKAKALGMDMVVVDDGWFGKRNDDRASLGDWSVHRGKFPHGLEFLADHLRGLGLKLGIWIEPEMVNPDSDLYRNHPDWVLQAKGREGSLSRNQLVLDFIRDEVVDYVAESIVKTLKAVRPDYIKWDFNRSLTEVGSPSLPAYRQGEAAHRFVLGSYKLHEKLTESFPDALFEGCSGGGGRFDPAILYYCPQIWASDQTDPFYRLPIQWGTATVYPLSTMGAHISHCRFNRLEKKPDYGFRFGVSLGGVTGYELDITKLTAAEEDILKAQTELIRRYQPLLLSGDLYRADGLYQGEYAYAVVSKDKAEFLFNYASVGKRRHGKIRLCGLKEDERYVDEQGRSFTGKELTEQGIPVPFGDGKPYAYAYFYFKAERIL